MKISAAFSWRNLLSQSGVAMVTVLFIGATLTVVASTAAYTTIQELQASREDRKAAEAFAYAESGIDRLVLELRRGKYTWGDIREAGCQRPALALPDGAIGAGTYDVELVAFDPFASTPQERFPIPPSGGACSAVASTSPRSTPPHYFAVTSVGQHPESRRVIRYVVAVTALNLPIGIYAENAAANGTPNFINISMITPGDVTGREKMGFGGSDPYYKISDFWSTGFTSEELSQAVPAAVHAVGHIFLKTGQANSREHLPGLPLNCTANKPGSPAGQSMWDQSGDGGPISPPGCAGWAGSPTGPPPTSLFTKAGLDSVTPKPTLSDQDYITLRDAAKQTGLYCFIPTTGAEQCTTGGASGGATTVGPSHIATPSPIPNNNFIAFFDFENVALAQSTNQVTWDAPVVGCNPTDPGRSAVIIIRGGSLRVEAGHFVNGALIAPEGTVEMRGGSTLNGTIIARKFDTNGTPTMQLNQCWIDNMPGPFLDVTPFQWSEIDR